MKPFGLTRGTTIAATAVILLTSAGCDPCAIIPGLPNCQNVTARSPLAASPAVGPEGAGLTNLRGAADAGCTDSSNPLAPPDAVFAPQGGTVWYSSGDGSTPSWYPLAGAPLGLQGRTASAMRCIGSRFYVATDRGLEWISTRDRSTGIFPAVQGAGVPTAVHPLSPGKVLAGTIFGRVLVCDEAANSCSLQAPLDPPFPGSAIAFAALPSGETLLLTAQNLFASSNGLTWTVNTSVPSGFYTKLFVSGSDAWVVGSGTSGLLHGIGNGTFSQAGPYDYNDSTHTLQNVNVVGLAAKGGSLYAIEYVPARLHRSSLAGGSWTPVSTLPASYGSSLAATPGYLWAGTGAGTLRSADGGTTWQPHNAGLTNVALPAVASGGGLAIAGGTLAGVWRSHDDCRTFTKAGSLPLEDFANVALVRADGTAFIGGSYLQRSTDGGNTWVKMNIPLNTMRGLLEVNGTLWASLLTLGVYRSTDGGVNWSHAGTGQPATAQYGDLATNGTALAATFGTTVVRSADGGATWTAGTAIPGASSVSGVAFLGNTLFASINQGTPGMFRSTDLGSTWTSSSTGLPTGVGFANVQNIGGTLYTSGAKFFSSPFYGAWRSVDGGATWTSLAQELEGANVAGFAASGSNVCIGTMGNSVFRLALVAAARRLVPVVLDVDTGATRYTTELSVANRGTSDASMTLQYTASLGSGSGSVSGIVVRRGEQWVRTDIVAYLRGQGLAIPATGQQAGTLLVTLENLSSNDVVGVVARTTAATVAPQPAGAAGLAYPGVDPALAATGSLALYGLRTTASDRTNLAVYNAGADPVTLSVTAHDGSGSGATGVVAAAEVLPPWGWKQYNRILEGTGYTNGWVTVERVSATGAFGAYGVVNDNATNDGSFVAAAPTDPRPLYLNVPVLVETPAFLSELVFTNASAKPANFVIGYRESLTPGGTGNDAILITVQPFTQRIVPNAIDWLRGQNFAIGARGAGYAGSLNLFVSSGGGVGQFYAGARTASPSAAGGQYGLFTGPAFAGDEATGVAYVYGLRADVDNRSNVAVLNTARDAAAGSLTLTLEVFDGDAGGVLRGTSTLVLAPGQWAQASGILANAGVANGWVRVTRTAGTAPWVAYGVVNDGGQPGQRTGDGAYVPMERQ